MSDGDLETKLQAVTNALVQELISLTPPTMSEVQFEFVATADGGADLGFLENHPAVTAIALSDRVFECAEEYLPLIKRYVPNWSRSLIKLRETETGWKVMMSFEGGG